MRNRNQMPETAPPPTDPAPEAAVEPAAPPEAPPLSEMDQLRRFLRGELDIHEKRYRDFTREIVERLETAERKLGEATATLEAAARDLGDMAEVRRGLQELSAEVSSVRSTVTRTADGLGRNDLITPPATHEEIAALYATGGAVKVLQDCTMPGFVKKAGTVLETQTFPRATLVDGVRSGKLKVAIIRRNRPESREG